MAAEFAAGGRGIVVGVDGSPLSVEALRWAARLTQVLGGPIIAVAAWHVPNAGFIEAAGIEWDPEGDARAVLETALTEAYGDRRPEGLEVRLIHGRPAPTLIGESRGARLLLVGSRGVGGFMGMLLGSVSRACVEHAEVPVLVLRSGPRTTPPPAPPLG